MTIPLSLLVLHFVADFICQNDAMATQKASRWDMLALHVTVYTVCFVWFGWQFMAVTWVTHFLTDAVTSRATSRLWFIPVMKIQSGSDVPTAYGTVFGATHYARPEMEKRHWFFVMIGFDQLIHFATLALTYRWLVTP